LAGDAEAVRQVAPGEILALFDGFEQFEGKRLFFVPAQDRAAKRSPNER